MSYTQRHKNSTHLLGCHAKFLSHFCSFTTGRCLGFSFLVCGLERIVLALEAQWPVGSVLGAKGGGAGPGWPLPVPGSWGSDVQGEPSMDSFSLLSQPHLCAVTAFLE